MSQREPAIRASDAERERASDALREHCATGRITPEELDERVDAVYAARTIGELRALLDDLPPLPAVTPRPGHDPQRELAKRRLLHRAGFWAVLCVAMVVIWAASGLGYFWPIWVMLGGGIAIGTSAWAQLGPGAAERRSLGRGSAARPPQPPAPPLPPAPISTALPEMPAPPPTPGEPPGHTRQPPTPGEQADHAQQQPAPGERPAPPAPGEQPAQQPPPATLAPQEQAREPWERR